MFQRSMRPLPIVLVSLAAIGACLAAEPLALIEVRGLERCRDEYARYLTAVESPHELTAALDLLLAPIGASDPAWIDPVRTVSLVLPGPEPAANWMEHWILVAPVRDTAAAIESLSRQVEGHEQQDAIHLLTLEDGSSRFARIEDDYLIAGKFREELEAFERRSLEAFVDLPRGSVVADVNLEALSALLQDFIRTDPTQPDTDTAQAGAPASDDGAEFEPAEVDPEREAVLSAQQDLVGFAKEAFAGFVGDTERVQLALALRDDATWASVRLRPRSGSTFGAFVLDQPAGFSSLARAIPAADAFVKIAGNIGMHEAFTEAFDQFYSGYVSRTQTLANSMAAISGNAEAEYGGATEWNRKLLDCFDGEIAMGVRFEQTMSFPDVRLIGVNRGATCDALVGDLGSSLGNLLGVTGEPAYDVDDAAVIHQGVTGMRSRLSPSAVYGQTVPEEVARQMTEAAPANYTGQLDDVLITASGPGATDRFTTVIDRLLDRTARGGITPESFAPLAAAGGLYVAIDAGLAVRTMLAEFDERLVPPSVARLRGRDVGTAVVGLRADHGWLALETAVPINVWEAITPMISSTGGVDHREGLWPAAPPPARDRTDPEESDAEEGDRPKLAGTDDVSLPVRKFLTKPVYPEPARLARLEGRVILQAVIEPDGSVSEITPLACHAAPKESDDDPLPVALDSEICRLFSDSAMRTVAHWKYEPALQDGEPVAVYFTIRIDFDLE